MPPNGSRLSCGRLARRHKGSGRSPAPARAQHSGSLRAITARQLQVLVRQRRSGEQSKRRRSVPQIECAASIENPALRHEVNLGRESEQAVILGHHVLQPGGVVRLPDGGEHLLNGAEIHQLVGGHLSTRLQQDYTGDPTGANLETRPLGDLWGTEARLAHLDGVVRKASGLPARLGLSQKTQLAGGQRGLASREGDAEQCQEGSVEGPESGHRTCEYPRRSSVRHLCGSNYFLS